MGEVWRARDTALQREVALKLLPAALARDAERIARFRREAKLLASLNHPNIAAIYGLEQSGGRNFLVMELAEGEDLSKRLAHGAIAIDEALEIARQIAEGLEAAHDKGIVHRDLKPANVKLAPDGTVKILDFGLARAYLGESGWEEEDPQNSPTITAAMTQQGVILGTAAYMSPEQARGKVVDRRADVWSFGVLLWEMLSGKRLFEGETISDTLAGVLRDEIPDEELPEDTPPVVRRLLDRCLERDSRKRLRDIGEARVRLERWKNDPSSLLESGSSLVAETSGHRWRTWAPWAVSALAVAIAAYFGLASPRSPEVRNPPLKLVIQLDGQDKFAGDGATSVFLSPQGDELAYLAAGRLHLKKLNELKTRNLGGNDPALIACYSPDGKWIAFTSKGKLYRVSVAGGSPVEICPAPDSRGISWVNESTLVFTPTFSAGLSMVSLSDGIVHSLTSLDSTRAERSHRWPHPMPDGNSVLFMCQYFGRDYDESDIERVDLKTKERTTVYRGGASPRYLPTGHLLFARGHTVFAIPLDPATGATRGLATPVLDNVWSSVGDQENDDGSAQFDVAHNGTVVYRTSSMVDRRSQLAWFDLATGAVTPLGSLATQIGLAISPDERSVAVLRGDDENAEIYVVDLEDGVENRLTFAAGGDMMGCWSPDGRYVFYGRPTLPSGYAIYRKPADGSGVEEKVIRWPGTIFPNSVSPDGRWLLFTAWGGQDLWDVRILDLDAPDAESRLIAGGMAQQFDAAFSHDGRWIAHTRSIGGLYQVYLRRFPSSTARWQILQRDGQLQETTWGEHDDVIYVRDRKGYLRIPLTFSGDGVRASTPEMIRQDTFLRSSNWITSQITADGKRAIVLLPNSQVDPTSSQSESKVVLITDWFQELERKMPATP